MPAVPVLDRAPHGAAQGPHPRVAGSGGTAVEGPAQVDADGPRLVTCRLAGE